MKRPGWLLVVALVALGFAGGLFMPRGGSDTAHHNKLWRAMALIDAEYVDSVSIDSLSEALMPTLLQSLDPYSTYISGERMQGVMEGLEGEFDGIGITFNMMTDTAIVMSLIPSGPAERVGVHPGDRILRIDDSLVAGQKIPQMDVVKMLRGRRGTQVRLALRRSEVAQPVDVTITRGPIPLNSVEAAFMLTPEVGYIRLSQFTTSSHEEVVEAMKNLSAKQGIILDLRGNLGGIYQSSILIANEFLPKKALIVYTEDRHGNRVAEYADGKGRYREMPLVVLIDEESASASEILAGALQDNNRATVIGRASYGKGSVQKQIPFEDGSAMRLTIARYHTPSGKALKPGEGIVPNVEVAADTVGVTRYYVEVIYRNTLLRYALEYTDGYRKTLDQITTLSELDAFFDRRTELVDDFVRYAARHGVKPDYHEIAQSRHLLEANLRASIGRNTVLGATALCYELYPIDHTLQRGVELLKNPPKSLSND